MSTTYDERLAGDYWGQTRFFTKASESEAVLGLNRSSAVNDAYGAWELRALERFAGGGGGLALDVGAGVGRVAAHLLQWWSVVTVDRAEGMARRCRANLNGDTALAGVVQGS